MNNNVDFIIIGASIIDVLAQPANAEVFTTGSCPAEQISMSTGGDAINEASVLAALSCSVRLISKIGQDFSGKYILSHCRQLGIDSSYFIIDPSIDTGINIVLVDQDGERHFITNPHGSLRKLIPADIADSALENGKYLCFASIFVSPAFDPPALTGLFSKAKKKGLITCADMTKRKNNETIYDLKECLQYLDYVFPNYEEACLLTGLSDLDAVADAFLGFGVKHVIIKTGSKGCFIKTRHERYLVSARPASRCIDTTGAGDTFTACFLYALNQGMTLEECGRFANAGASLCIEQVGATGAIQNIRQIWNRLGTGVF